MSRADRFDRADFEGRYREGQRPPASSEGAPKAVAESPRRIASAETPRTIMPRTTRGVLWPIAPEKLLRAGESVMAHRKGTHRPHKGIDLFAEAGTEVRVARGGSVLRVVDGRKSKSESLRRAGLFVDVRGADALVYRYLHLAATRSPERAYMPGEGDPDHRKEGNRVLDNLSFVLVRFQPPRCQGEALSPSLRLTLNG